MSTPGLVSVGSLVVAVVLTVGLLRYTRRLWLPAGTQAEVRVMGTYSPVLSWMKYKGLGLPGRLALRQGWLALTL